MIDRKARNIVASNLRRFIGGQISNDEWEALHPDSDDPAIRAVSVIVWPLYCDLREHKLTDDGGLHPMARRELQRWILFLDSDFEFVWPPGIALFVKTPPKLIARMFPRYAARKRAQLEMQRAANSRAWPFASHAQYKMVLRNPRRLSGRGLRPAS